jgi:thiamine-monophosphate kinase
MDKSEKKISSLRELGKVGLIDHIKSKVKLENDSSIIGIGDDAAIIDSGQLQTVVSTDLLLEGIHFNLIYSPLKHLGYKAVIRAISDIYAMNATPKQILISLGLSSRFNLNEVDEIYNGISLACDKYKVDLVGGDTTSSLTGLTIAVTAIGTVKKSDTVKRDGAIPNDLICVTGDFGASFIGLQLLERERKLFEKEKGIQPDLVGFEYVLGRQLKPEFPAATLTELHDAKIMPSSMIDVTDGLASDLLQICKLSDVGCKIFSDKIPIDYETSRVAEDFNINPIIPALNGGEDYELLFTIPLDSFEKIQLIKSVKIIGHITQKEEGCNLVDDNGSEIKLSANGWIQES